MHTSISGVADSQQKVVFQGETHMKFDTPFESGHLDIRLLETRFGYLTSYIVSLERIFRTRMTLRLKFLIISYLALGRYVRALPLIIAADQSTSSDRTKINIIWTCLITIFSCTWVAVHPNIPAPETKGIEIALRRLRLMVISLVAPEVVIVWAMRQWIAARKLAHQHKGALAGYSENSY